MRRQLEGGAGWLRVQVVADLVHEFGGVEPHGGVLAVPALLAFGVDEDEAVAGQSRVFTPSLPGKRFGCTVTVREIIGEIAKPESRQRA